MKSSLSEDLKAILYSSFITPLSFDRSASLLLRPDPNVIEIEEGEVGVRLLTTVVDEL